MDCHLLRVDVHNAFLLVLVVLTAGCGGTAASLRARSIGCSSCNYQSRRAQYGAIARNEQRVT